MARKPRNVSPATLLTEAFFGSFMTAPGARQRKAAPKPPPLVEYQVYTRESGAAFNHNPAVITRDRTTAERIAAQVGGHIAETTAYNWMPNGADWWNPLYTGPRQAQP